MISFEMLNAYTYRAQGLDPRVPAAAWHIALRQMAGIIQADISRAYGRSRTALGAHFRPNTPEYTLWKARKGFDTRRGHKENRTHRALQRRTLHGVSTPTPRGTAVVTMLEEALYALEGHARYYARRKVPGRRILQINPTQLEVARWPLDALQARANDPRQRPRERDKMRGPRAEAAARRISISTGPQHASMTLRTALPTEALANEIGRSVRLMPSADRIGLPPTMVNPALANAGRSVRGPVLPDAVVARTAAARAQPDRPRRPLTLAATARAAVASTTFRLRRL